MRASWAKAAGLALALAACGRAADPLAQAERLCAESDARAQARIEACTSVAEAPGLEAQRRVAALAHRGDAKRKSGDATGALRDYEAALAEAPEHTPALIGRGAILLESGQLDAAQPLLERARAADESGEAEHLLGRVALGQGDYARAIAHFDAALARNGGLARALSARARAKEAQGDAAGARADYNAAIAADGTLAEARAGRCWLNLREERDLDQARNDAEAAVAADPRAVNAQLCRGVLQLRGGEWANARASFEAALAVEPGNPTALFGRGVARRRSGEDAGREDMNLARDFERNIGRAFDEWGVETY